jgi:hypothetical protein
MRDPAPEDEDWGARYRVQPESVTDPTGTCVGTTVCGVVKDGGSCVDVCAASRWTPPEMPALNDADAEMVAALDAHLKAVHLGERCPSGAMIGGGEGGGGGGGGGGGELYGAASSSSTRRRALLADGGDGDGDGDGIFAEGSDAVDGDAATDAASSSSSSVSGEGGGGLGFISYHALSRGSFGAHLLHSARGLARATAFNRTLVSGRLSLRPWTSSKRCGMQRNLLCYLQPFTSCTLDLHDSTGRHAAAAMVPDAQHDSHDSYGGGGGESSGGWNGHDDHLATGGYGGDGGGDAGNAGGTRLLPDFAPPEFAARGTLWFLARTLSFMLKTNGAAKTVISKALAATLAGSEGGKGGKGGGVDSLGLRDGGGGCIAMHIRRQHRSCKGYGANGQDGGSGSAGAAPCIPLTRYMDEVTALVELYNISTVVGLYKLNAADPQLASTRFQPLSL